MDNEKVNANESLSSSRGDYPSCSIIRGFFSFLSLVIRSFEIARFQGRHYTIGRCVIFEP
jgi:hypothetical protein